MDNKTITRRAYMHESRKCAYCGRFMRAGQVYRFFMNESGRYGAFNNEPEQIWHDNADDCATHAEQK